jgi:HlyD family secretion protein
MNVTVDFLGEAQPQSLTVPAVAVIYQNNQQGVIVWNPNTHKPEYQAVETGITQSGVTQILQGLSPDDRVFTSLPPGKTLKDFTDPSQQPKDAGG